MTQDLIEMKQEGNTPNPIAVNASTPITPVQSTTPATLLQQAIASGADPDILQKLMDAQERWEDRQARKAFASAIASARQEIPTIYKSKKGHGYHYAGLDDIARLVVPILAKHGLSYRWRTEQSGDMITIICVIEHQDGHQEHNAMSSNINAVGTKLQNSIQAMGSAVTYLQRYTLNAALGLASSLDDDAAACLPDNHPISTSQRDHLISLLQEHEISIEKFCTAYGITAVASLRSSDYQKALTAINRSIAARKQQAQQDTQQEKEQAHVN